MRFGVDKKSNVLVPFAHDFGHFGGDAVIAEQRSCVFCLPGISAVSSASAILAVWCAWRLKDLPEDESLPTEIELPPDSDEESTAASVSDGLGSEVATAEEDTKRLEIKKQEAATQQSPGAVRTLLWLALAAV